MDRDDKIIFDVTMTHHPALNLFINLCDKIEKQTKFKSVSNTVIMI